MSAKVCVQSVKPEWRDATTIGGLLQMIAALIALGHDENTAVTYLYDSEHVYLETVHDIEDDEPEPRVVHRLGPDERSSKWTSAQGGLRTWDGSKWRGSGGASYCGDPSLGPYTEVLG